MQNQGLSFLQQKQQYLRANINEDWYEDFYEYCEGKIGNVDVNSWTMPYTQIIVNQFLVHKNQLKQSEDQNDHQRSYNDYQSGQPNQKADIQYNNDMDDCKSSRIGKSSAVDLLDEAFQTSSVSQSQNNDINRTNSLNFDDFDFFTSGSVSQKPVENRQKSMTQQGGNNSNVYAKSSKNSPTHTPKYDPRYSIHNTRNRNSTDLSASQYSYGYGNRGDNGDGLDAFMDMPSTKKTSPYMKKQKNQQPYMVGQQQRYEHSEGNQTYMNNSKTQQIQNSYRYQNNRNIDPIKIKVKQVKQYDNMDIWGNPTNKTSKVSSSKIANNQNNTVQNSKIFMTNINTNINKAENSANNNNDEKNNTVSNGKWILQQIVFSEYIPCFKSTNRSQLANPNLNVFIDDKYEIVQRSFLAPDYPMFTLKVVPLGIQCKRNYDDFTKLKKNLQKFFPGMHLAYLDDNSWFSGTDDQFIQKQKKMLELFMRDLLRNKQVRNSRVMEDFITLKDHKSIKRKFEKYEKMSQLQGIQQLCLLNGRVNVTISNQQKNYLNHLNRFIHKMDDCFSRHRKLTDNLSKQYQQLMATTNSLIKLMSDIEKQIKNFNSKVTVSQLKNLGNVYRVMKQTYKQDYSSLKFELQVLTKKISPFLKYEHQNMLGLKKILQTQHKMHKTYDKRSINQKIEMGQGYNSQQARVGKKGITEQSKNILVLKYQVGYFGNQGKIQGQRIFDEMGYKIIRRWQTIAQNYLDRYTKNIQYRKNLGKLDADKYLPVQIQAS